MKPSQVRRLARDYAQGVLEREAYVARRRTLIDAICSGAEKIARQPDPVAVPAPAPANPAPSVAPSAAPAQRLMVRLLWGGGGLLVLVLVLWAALPAPTPAPPPAPVAAPVPLRQISAARALVESFVAAADWSESALGQFLDDWERIAASEREGALSAPWMHRLRNALRQETRTQRALAEVDDTGAAQATIERLSRFASRIGLTAASAPATTIAAEPASAVMTTTTPVAGSASPEATSAAPNPANGDTRMPAGRQWLAAQPATGFTLQLFALDHLDRIERIIAAHPQVNFHVIAEDPGTPRFRVLYGSYASPEQAREDYARLPLAVRREQPQPLVKTIAELRRGIGAASPPATPPAAGNQFTVQVFVSNNRDNVDRLVAKYPQLALKVHESAAAALRYRVLMGKFASREAALAAAARIPPEMLRDAGKPLVKSLAEIGAAG